MLLTRIFVPHETKICELAVLTSPILEPVSVVLSVQYFCTFSFFFLRTWGHLKILKQLSKLRPKEDWNRMFPLTVYYLFKSIVFPFILIYVYLSILKSNAYEYREYFWMTLREVSKHIFLKYCTIVKFLGKFIFLIDGINKITLAAACLNQVALL